MGKKLIQLENITKTYDGNMILDDLNLYVKENEFLTLLGPSGCGKTTTLRMIAGFESPDEGEIYLGDEAINSLTPNKRDTAMVFQSYALLPHYNVFDNVAYGLKIRKLPKEEIKERVLNILKLVEMDGMESRMTNQLSGGQQQRVSIGRAIVKNPDILLCDEPTGALDYNTSKEILRLIETVNQKYGNTIVMVTHNDAIKDMADRVVKLRDGMIRKNYRNEHKVSADELDW